MRLSVCGVLNQYVELWVLEVQHSTMIKMETDKIEDSNSNSQVKFSRVHLSSLIVQKLPLTLLLPTQNLGDLHKNPVLFHGF